MIKKLLKYALIALGAFFVAGFVGFLTDPSVPEELSQNEKIKHIIENNSCLDCHSQKATLPWYANVPIASTILQGHITRGTEYLDLDHLLSTLENPDSETFVDMAKLEQTAITNSMPIHAFRIMHWQSGLTKADRQAILDWAKDFRAKYVASNLAAPEFANEPIQPMPASIETDSNIVLLGKVLYHDTRLSHDNTVSCATCHPLASAGVDGTRTSKGIYDQWGGINAPTVYNAAWNLAQFWDGRAKDLTDQIFNGPPLDPMEMGSNWEEIVGKFKEDPKFVEQFDILFEDGLTGMNIARAIAEFEKTLITPNSRFDQYLKGNKEVLSKEEVDGYELFKKYNCATCHSGVNVGGYSYEKLPIQGDYYAERTAIALHDKDKGRNGVTGTERDYGRFKVPTLRNVELTAPYLHDGSAETLDDAIQMISKYITGKDIPADERALIVAFLKTLTGSEEEMACAHCYTEENKNI